MAMALGAEFKDEEPETDEPKKESVFDRAKKKMDEKYGKPSKLPEGITGYTKI